MKQTNTRQAKAKTVIAPPKELVRKQKLSAEKVELQPGESLLNVSFSGYIKLSPHLNKETGEEKDLIKAVFTRKSGEPVWITKNSGIEQALMLVNPMSKLRIDVVRLPDVQLDNGNSAAKYDVFELA